MKRSLVLALSLLALALMAQAHFIFVVPETASKSARVFLSEQLEPDSSVGMSLVAPAKLSLRDAAGAEKPLTLVKGDKFYTVELPGEGQRLVHGLLDLGFSNNREGTKAHLLLYHPKTILGDAFAAKAKVGDVATEIVPIGKPGALKLLLLGNGKPVADGEIHVILPGGAQKVVKTDASGTTAEFAETGQFGAWARFWEQTAGERDGKKYEEVRHYATLVFQVPVKGVTFASLPQATASFGATAAGDWLYVYGGHIAKTHSYDTSAVSGRFDRVRLSGDPVWEGLPGGPALQGMNLVSYQGKVYRIGGMTCLNKPGDPANNHSVAESAVYDPAKGRWEALPNLPEARSSHDLAVIGSKLYVVGGWQLEGQEQKWMNTMLVMDLAAKKPVWESLGQPFKRRALMAGVLDGKLWVVGGINEFAKVDGKVSIFDPKAGTWTDGPRLPEGKNLGFAPAVGVHEGKLYVSIADGSLLRLNASGQVWEPAGSTSPRVAHRLAFRGDTLLVVGGADKGENSSLIEAVTLDR